MELCRPSVGRRGLLCMIWWHVVCDLEGLLCSPAVNVVRVAHVSWSLLIDLGLLFVDVSLGGVTREDGDRRSESVAVLGHRARIGWVLHRADVLDDDVFVVGGAVDEAQVGADVSRARRQAPLVWLSDDAAYVVTVDHAGRQ